MVATVRHQPAKIGRCVRCIIPKPATTTRDLTLGEDSYLLRLCEQHADMFTDQMFGWTRLGEILLPVSVHARSTVPDPGRETVAHDRIPAGRVVTPAAVAVVEEEVEDEEPAWPESVPESIRELARSAPGIVDWKLSGKARERADEAGVQLIDVLLAAEAPEEVEPSSKDENSALHSRGGVTAVVNPRTQMVLTMFVRKEKIRGIRAS